MDMTVKSIAQNRRHDLTVVVLFMPKIIPDDESASKYDYYVSACALVAFVTSERILTELHVWHMQRSPSSVGRGP